MAKIGVVAVPYITYQSQFTFLAETIVTLLQNESKHELDLIAVINRFDLDYDHLERLRKTFHLVLRNDQNILARAWNIGFTHALDRGADYVLLINLDLCFHHQFITNLVLFAEQHPETLLWSGVGWPEHTTLNQAPLLHDVKHGVDFSCVLCDRLLFEKMGKFDEQFAPAYHEDSDMLYRLQLAGIMPLSTSAARFYHLQQVTIKCAIENQDLSFVTSIRKHLDSSMELYRAKWGGYPGHEQFVVPYGNAQSQESR